MNIAEDKHYVSVPKLEYEDMVRVVNEKQDINVVFRLTIYHHGGYYQFGKEIDVQELVININEKMDYSVIIDTKKLIKTACDYVAQEKGKEIEYMQDKLDAIKAKWWYKIFNW